MNSLQPPFSDIVGESSPVQKAIKMLWEIFANHPLPNNKSIASQSAAEQIVLHLLGTMNSIGMINAAGYHSAAVTLMRSIYRSRTDAIQRKKSEYALPDGASE